MKLLKDNRASKPNIFQFYDLHEALGAQLKYLETKEKLFSLRKFAKRAGFHHGHLSKVLKGAATLTSQSLIKLGPHLELNQEELAFLHLLRDLSESRTQQERVKAFKKISNHRWFREENKEEIYQHRFLSRWYYPVIREMARLPNFQADHKWIRSQLSRKITKKETQEALDFLFKHQYIVESEDGTFSVPQVTINCSGGVYRLAASEYHEEVLQIARDSIHNVDRDFRQIMSHTLAMPRNKIDEVREILKEAAERISQLQMEDDERDSVYQVSLLAFPMLKTSHEGELS